MSQVYSDYAKARLGWLPFGLTGWQGAIVAASSLPVFWSLKEPVSYTHLDVYKRQPEGAVAQLAAIETLSLIHI